MWNEIMLFCDESERTLKETTFSYFMVLSQCLTLGTREFNGNFMTLSFHGAIHGTWPE